MNLYISDLHFGHTNAIKFDQRPFTDVDEMDRCMIVKYANEDDPCSLDFRYFPKGWEDNMETYSWSDNIARAVIKNETDHILRFNHVDIPIGETMIFDPDGSYSFNRALLH